MPPRKKAGAAAAAGQSAARPKKAHPKYEEMIGRAIIDDASRTGSSRPTLIKYIAENWKLQPDHVRVQLKTQLPRLVKKGWLVPHKASFRLSPEARAQLKKADKPAAKKKPAAKRAAAKRAAAKRKESKAVVSDSDPDSEDGIESDERCLLLGLDGSGKTVLLYRLKLKEVVDTIPTIGFNVEAVETIRANEVNRRMLTIWDVGGQEKIRSLWRHYYSGTDYLFWVVDASRAGLRARGDESREELHKTLAAPDFTREGGCKGILIWAIADNGDDRATQDEVAEKLQLDSIELPWHVHESNHSDKIEVLHQGLEWVWQQS